MNRQQRRQFLEERQTGIGGSDIGALFGLSRWSDALDVYHSKTRPITDADVDRGDDNVDLERGTRFEPVALAMFRDRTGRATVSMGTLRHPTQRWAMVHVDAIQDQVDQWETLGVVEAKCPRSATYRTWLEEGFPVSHVLQLQWGMYVGGYAWGTNLAMNGECDPMLTWVDLPYNADLMNGIAAEVDRFWHEHVVPRVPPDVAEWRALGAKLQPPRAMPTTTDLVPVDDAVLVDAAARYAEAQAAVKKAEAERDEVKGSIQERIASLGLEAVQVPAGKFYYRWSDGRGSLDRKKLEGAHLVDYDKARKFLAMQGWGDGEAVAELDKLAANLAMYERISEPYRSLRFYAAKEAKP